MADEPKDIVELTPHPEIPTRSIRGRWLPGTSGKTEALPKRIRSVSDEIKKLLRQKVVPFKTWHITRREALGRKMLKQALKGSLPHQKMVLAYTEGLPIERKEVSGPGGGPQESIIGKVDFNKLEKNDLQNLVELIDKAKNAEPKKRHKRT